MVERSGIANLFCKVEKPLESIQRVRSVSAKHFVCDKGLIYYKMIVFIIFLLCKDKTSMLY